MSSGQFRRHLAVVSVFALLAGCNRVEVTPVVTDQPSATADADGSDIPVDGASTAPSDVDQGPPHAEVQPWISSDQLPWDAWYLQYLGGKRVGYYHIQVSQGEHLYSLQRQSLFELNVNGQPTQFQVDLESYEYLNGRLASFTERTSTQEGFTEVSGQLLGKRLNLVIKTDAGIDRTSLVWQDNTWGVFDIQSVLMAYPLQPGQQLEAKLFAPKLRKIVSAELLAGEREITSLPGGSTPELLPIDVTIVDDQTQMRTRNWINDAGEILKSISLDGTMTSSFRAPTEVGERVADEYLLKRSLITTTPYAGAPLPPGSNSARYMVDGSGSDLYRMWSKNVRQTVKSISALNVEITVERTPAEVEQQPPTAADAQAAPMIQRDHPTIADMARRLLAESATPDDSARAKAMVLTQGVFRTLKRTEFSATLASALETCRRLEGDCTEHAMLLVALLRNQRVPARVAAGIQLDAEQSIGRYHMWAEAWIGDRWLSLDATQGGETDLNCLKLIDSALAEENTYPTILPILEKMTRLEIRELKPQ